MQITTTPTGVDIDVLQLKWENVNQIQMKYGYLWRLFWWPIDSVSVIESDSQP